MSVAACSIRLGTGLLLLALSVASGATIKAPAKALSVGVAPYLSTRALLEVYRPLQTHLQGRLGMPVELFTAADFRSFYENMVQGDYDLCLAPAHLARLAQIEHGFVPLVRYTSGGRGLLVVKQGSNIARIVDLRGRTVAAPDRLAFGTVVVFEWLRARGVRPDQDFRVVQTPSFSSAMHALENGDAVAAVSAPAALAQMSPHLRANIRVLADAGEFFNLVYLAHPRVPNAERLRLKSALLHFARDTARGKQFFRDTQFGGFIEAAPEDLRAIDPYLAETRRLLQQPQPAR
jgi:phosphonate transport system substrate-binding protein